MDPYKLMAIIAMSHTLWIYVAVLATFWIDPGLLVLCSNKPLDHWPFRQQATKQPAVSPEVTYGGTKK
jgi:hypothetical protein